MPFIVYGSQEHNHKGSRIHEFAEQAAYRYGVESALVKAMIMAESGFDKNAVSDKGALGLMQLMPNTAEELGVEDCFDPQQNIDAGVRGS
jgi:soluble lytic murein transglycosylase-like protein